MNIQTTKFQTTRDGRTIRGIEYRPPGDNLPIAIVSHGFLANLRTTKHYALQLAQWGFCAYCFDFIGGGVFCRSDGKMKDMSVMTEKADLQAVMAYAASRDYTKADGITLMGCSQGGFVSALVAAEEPSRIARLILLYPALCIPDDARKGKMMMFEFDPENIPDSLSWGPIKLSGRYVRDVINIDPYQAIAPYTGPVLILHGEKDAIVDVSYAHRAGECYGSSCTVTILPDAAHGFRKETDAKAFTYIQDFLEASSK